jgi:zinc transport system substrate-binding protein
MGWRRWLPGAAMATVMTLAMLGAAGCGDGAADEGRTLVVAGFYPLAEATTRVGGDAVEVVNLTPAGSEPHDLEPTADQVDRVEDADLVVLAGGGFQPALEELADRRDGETIDVIGEDADPHVWLDPLRFGLIVDAIAEALSEISPDDADEFEANAESYRAELVALDEEFRAGLSSCRRDDIVTAHGAFGHLADRYGLNEEPITGIDPESEPDPDRLDELTRLIEDRGVTTVFYETLVPAELAETLAREAGIDVAVLNPIEGLTEEQTDDGVTYLDLMRENLDALRSALGCTGA